MTDTYGEFISKYTGPKADRVVVNMTNDCIEIIEPGEQPRAIAHGLDQYSGTPFIGIHGKSNRSLVLNPILGLGFGQDHLCVDAHGFINGDKAMTGVAGWHGEVGSTGLRPTGYTSHGWNATGTIALLLGKQEITDKPEKIGDVLEDIMDDVGAEWGMDVDLKARYVERLRNAR